MWRVHFKDDAQKSKGATLGMWMLAAFGANPMYDYYVVVLTHLRDEPELKGAVKFSPDAMYEVSILVLNPEHPVPNFDELESKVAPINLLSDEAEVLIQFARINGGDDLAYATIDTALSRIVEGKVVPVDDYRVQWSQTIFQCVLAVTDKPPMEVN
jgi:hypothetical protein